MDVSTLKVNVFMRKLLLGSIGKLTIESEEWELPVNVKIPFGRTFFNDRLKYATPINIKTHRGLIFIFSYLFSPDKHGGKYGEAQAVNASNSIIKLLTDSFGIDLSVWHNDHAKDNSRKRECILHCLDNILTLCVNKEKIDIDVCKKNIKDYLADLSADEDEKNAFTIDELAIILEMHFLIFWEQLRISRQIFLLVVIQLLIPLRIIY